MGGRLFFSQTPFINHLEKGTCEWLRGAQKLCWWYSEIVLYWGSTPLQIILSNETNTTSIHSPLQNGPSKNIEICNTPLFFFTNYAMYNTWKSTVHAYGNWRILIRSSEKLHQRRTVTNPCHILGDDQHSKALCNVAWCFSQL